MQAPITELAFFGSVTRNDFKADTVLYSITVIGEAVKRLSPELAFAT